MNTDDLLHLLPPDWQAALAGRAPEPAAGMGGAAVFRVPDPVGGGGCYLKLARGDDAALLRQEIARARDAIDRNLVDVSQFDDRNAGVTPDMLYRRLASAVPAPADVIVVTHGDATLENMLIGADGELGFIDCGQAGRSDRYLDLALVEADLRADFGPEAAEAFRTAYGVRDWDDRKAAFFRDLYELF
jgi:aminoglycoside phosphotransferase